MIGRTIGLQISSFDSVVFHVNFHVISRRYSDIRVPVSTLYIISKLKSLLPVMIIPRYMNDITSSTSNLDHLGSLIIVITVEGRLHIPQLIHDI